MNKFLPAALLPLVLAGCVSIGAKVPDTLLSLTPEAAPEAGATASGRLGEALSVLEPSAEAKVAVLRVPVQIDGANIAYLKKTMWVERPARQFQHLLTETLRARGNRLVVENDEGTKGLRVGGRLLDMGYDVRSRSVVVRFDAVKERPGGAIETRRFESTVPNVEADQESVGPALNTAANVVAKQVADWVG
ncbi:ABC-type transport auxiliary lipoprotein family protein [Novosphingobium sp. KCTC 2891]|uniref:ABC-type transport auxiliary lipoprotein family protein n=1 Tax=Novosphingobium sp. KCTC 2891 TaxID=2989730 RepID=UPI002221D086|nr:ABC-type transport auxiliary lipoprotein family protein [Novosphingobium sp. KCTC 2891]MCW1383956.1 ABC-type transport auxiliary lipoprotein family protein [Novosphingobium sp. KCTC 2891]